LAAPRFQDTSFVDPDQLDFSSDDDQREAYDIPLEPEPVVLTPEQLKPDIEPELPEDYTTRSDEANLERWTKLRDAGISRYIAFHEVEGYKYCDVKTTFGGFVCYRVNPEGKAVAYVAFTSNFHHCELDARHLPSLEGAYMETPYVGTPIKPRKKTQYRGHMKAAQDFIYRSTDIAGTRKLAESINNATSSTVNLAQQVTTAFQNSIAQNTQIAADTVDRLTTTLNDNSTRLMNMISDLKATLLSAARSVSV
jgi:hypothetical protein